MTDQLIGLYYTAQNRYRKNQEISKRNYLDIEVAAIIIGTDDAEADVFNDDNDILKKINKLIYEKSIYWSTLDIKYFQKILDRLKIKKCAKYALTRLELMSLVQQARSKDRDLDLLLGMLDIGKFHSGKIGNFSKEDIDNYALEKMKISSFNIQKIL